MMDSLKNKTTMKRFFLITLTVLGLVMPALAQDKKTEERIQLAREKYAEALENIAFQLNEDTPANYTTVVRKQNWAAVGERTDKMEFYYNEIEEEGEPYPVGYALLMARRTYNVTVRDHLEEYLFDDKGKPLFYFTRFQEIVNSVDYFPTFEIRLYFDENGKQIRSIYKMSDENGKMKEFTEKSNPELMNEIYFDTDFSYIKNVFDAIY